MTLSPEAIGALGAIAGGALAGLVATQANNAKVDAMVSKLIALELELLAVKRQRDVAMTDSALLQWPDLGDPHQVPAERDLMLPI